LQAQLVWNAIVPYLVILTSGNDYLYCDKGVIYTARKDQHH